MRCPKNPKFDMDEEDPRWADHLASCASCRFEASRAAQLQTVLQALPQPEAPVAVATRLHQLAAATDWQSLECGKALELLEPYREGFLDEAQTFLVEDHLLWCTSCAAALETADSLTLALRALPHMTPPDAIAERLATARVPWWQRLWTAPAPSWNPGRLLQVGGVMAVVALCFAMLTKPQRTTTVAELIPTNKVLATEDTRKPSPVVPPIPAVMDTKDAMGFTGPVRASGILSKPVSPPRPMIKTDTYPSLPDEDRAPGAMDKAVALLNGMRQAPVVKITPRGSAPTDTPVVAQVSVSSGADDNDYPMVNQTDKPEDPPVVASAREAFISMNRDEELARNEEALASLPDTMKIALATVQPESSLAAATQPVCSNAEVSKTLIMDIKRHTTPLVPIEAKSDHAPTPHTGVWITIK